MHPRHQNQVSGCPKAQQNRKRQNHHAPGTKKAPDFDMFIILLKKKTLFLR
jgi:hypothetical protein